VCIFSFKVAISGVSYSTESRINEPVVSAGGGCANRMRQVGTRVTKKSQRDSKNHTKKQFSFTAFYFLISYNAQ
jgi:hypothetical protein